MDRVKTGIVMPSGWHYMQPIGGKEVRVEGYDLFNLYDNVREFRLHHRQPVGAWKDDVDNFICKHWPHQCRDAPFVSGVEHHAINGGTRFVDKIAQWAVDVMGKRPGFVFPEEAERRALTCQGCPHNTDWENQCPTCVSNAQRLLLIIRQNRETSLHGRLKACSKTNQCNRTAAWLERKFLPAAPSDAPDFCWLR